MNTKYLELRFRNAKVFRDKRNTKDRVFDKAGIVAERKNVPWQKEPITASQISNVIHMLCNERPVPSMRKTFIAYTRVEKFFEAAKNSFLRIDSLKVDRWGKGVFEYIPEITKLHKALPNAWVNTALPIYWMRAEKHLGSNLAEFVERIEAILGPDQRSRSFDSLHYDINVRLKSLLGFSPNLYGEGYKALVKHEGSTDPLVEFMFFLKNSGNTSMGEYFFCKEIGAVRVNSSPHRGAVTVVSGVDSVSLLSGSIIIPVDDEMIESIRNGNGFSRILDGGVVEILGLLDPNEFSTEGYQKVGDISMETY